MKKNSINKRIKVKADLNQNSEQSEENSNEKEKENEITPENDSTSNNTYRCPNCFSIPIINVKDNENKVILDCLQGHHIEMLFSEYMANEFQKNTSKLICSQCREDKNSKKIMRICFECKKLFCKDCLSSHNKSNPNHHLNTIDKADINCPLHKSKYTYFCSECKKNLCDECVKEKNDGHQLIYFQNINLKNHELTEIKNNLEKENQILFKIKKIFNDTLVTLSNKFNDIMSYKFLCLKYKNNIINTYETKDTNYQIIDNVNHLKFITKDLKIEPEMNELDIIYELFNFLDSIEYNDENNNGNTNDNNNNINNNDSYHINNSYNMNENNKLIIDTKNKIEESEHEDDIESEKENNSNENNNKFSENKNIKVEENEKDDDEDDKREEESDTIRNKDKTKNEYIKITDNNDNEDNDNDNDNEKEDEKPEETENSNDVNKNMNNKVNMVTSSNDDLVNQVTPNKITKKVIVKKVEKMEEEKVNNNDEDEESEKNEEIKEEDESNKKENNKIKNDINDNNEVSESLLNDNEGDMYIYKSTQHIPVTSESTQNLGEKDKLSRTEKNIEDILENKEKEPKKRKKKVLKKKKIKQIIQQGTQDDIESEPKATKTKKKVIKRTRTKDKLIKKEEKIEDENDKKEETKNEPKEEKDEESKDEHINSNMRIEVNENDSNNQINSNIHIEENENDKNEKEENNNEDISNDDITDNNDVSKTEDEKEDDLSNDNKIEEVPNTNYEEFKENRSVKKKVKHVKKKKKKKLNIAKTESIKEQNPKIEIINTENRKEKNLIYNNNPKVGMKIESLRYENHDDEEPEDLDKQEKTIERHIEKHIEVITDTNNDEDDKSKNSKSSKKNKKITIKKKLKMKNSDKGEDEDDDDEENKTKNKSKSKSKVSININTNLNEKDNSVDSDMKRKINKLNKIVNMNLKLDNDGSLDNSRGSQRVKKRKKIKKKKYLICVDNNGKNIIPNPEEEKQLKITKTTTLIRSRSKERPPRNGNSQESNKDKVVKNKEINFKIFEDGDDSSIYNEENSSSNKKKEITNIRTKKNIRGINKIKKDLGSQFEAKGSRKMRMTQGKNNAAFLLENQTEVYFEEKNIIKAKNKGLDTFEIQYDREALNRSVDGYDKYKNRRRIDGYDYDYDEVKYLIERSNSYKKMKNYKKFNEREKINCMKFENGISCLLEINPTIFAIGNLIGDIIVINSHTYKEMQVIREHDGTIISLCLLHDKSILSCSADRKMLKIRTNQNGTKYNIEFSFTGYDNYILKGIELMNTFKIITCSWDDKLFVWERIDENNYKNSLIFNEGERVVDLLEINVNHFVSISENNELKIWSSDTCEMIDTIKNIKCIGAPNALCKITDFVICVLDYHEIQLIDIMEHRLINKISVDDGNLSCIIKLNDNSILLAEDFNSDKYCVFYMKQFYYELEDFKPISYKKDKFFKTNKNNDKEIRALVQFSNGVIVQGVTGEYNGNDSGDLFFYY